MTIRDIMTPREKPIPCADGLHEDGTVLPMMKNQIVHVPETGPDRIRQVVSPPDRFFKTDLFYTTFRIVLGWDAE